MWKRGAAKVSLTRVPFRDLANKPDRVYPTTL
jgi:hypothetical protein